ncbi:sulfite exporter TauE/SafE family protein [Paenibacillus sp. F411]|uniref:sulfite exporter TauE/SafE family protein n=1 Tax=Paenibacillus sp. F411 TaxID=2820239 RepID=UPI001FBBDB7D|nr:sulfite exporter TauE/SafE family protein [Paenibacillus sp. F411]
MDILWITGMLVIVLAGFIQGLTSFGFALITLPFLAQLVPLTEAVPLVVILSLCTNLVIFTQTRDFIDLRSIWLLILCSVLAAPLGTKLLLVVEAGLLKAVSGAVIVVAAGLLLAGRSYPIRRERLGMVPVGILTGLLNGSISMSGPPVVLFLSNQGVDKQVFRANLNVYGILLNLVTISTFVYSGLITEAVLLQTAWYIPCLLIGVLIGLKAVRRLNEQRFKRFALGFILISGGWLLIQSLF